MEPPKLYYDTKKRTWTETVIQGAVTWQHQTLVGYRAWKRAQLLREAAKLRHRAIRKGEGASAMDCLRALLAHWEGGQ